MADTEPRATPADIAEMTRYATASRRPALRDLEEVTRCHCGPAWASRGLHSTHCLAYLRSEVEALYQAGVQAGREAAAQALLACVICGQIHPWRETPDGSSYAAPDGHPWHPAANDCDGPEALATIARGQAPPEVCPATTDLYGADIPCARSPGHRDPHQSHNPIITWGEDWRYEEEGDTDG